MICTIGIFEAKKKCMIEFKFGIACYLGSNGLAAYIETHPNKIEVVRCMVTSKMHTILGLYVG